MGSRGPAPKVTSIRYADRKYKPRRTLADIPVSELGKAKMPHWMDREAKAFWRKHAPAMEARGLLTQLDEISFALVCTSWSMLREAERLIAEEGMVLIGPRGAVKPHPAIRIRDTAWKQFVEGVRQFGLTPVSRQRIPLPPMPTPMDPFEAFLERSTDGA